MEKRKLYLSNQKYAVVLFLLSLITVLITSSVSHSKTNIDQKISEAIKAIEQKDKELANKLLTDLIGSGKLSIKQLEKCYFERTFTLYSRSVSQSIVDLRRVIEINPKNKKALIRIINLIDAGMSMSRMSFTNKVNTAAGMRRAMANSAVSYIFETGVAGWLILHVDQVNKIFKTARFHNSLDQNQVKSNYKQNLKVAIEIFSKVIANKKNPLYLRVWNQYDRSVAYELIGDYKNAISDMEEVIKSAQKDPVSIKRYSYLLKKQGMKKEEVTNKIKKLSRKPMTGYMYLAEKKIISLAEIKPMPVFGISLGQKIDDAAKVASSLMKKYGFMNDNASFTKERLKDGSGFILEPSSPIMIRANRDGIVRWFSFSKKIVDKMLNTSNSNDSEFFSKAIASLPKYKFKKGAGLFGLTVWNYYREDKKRIQISTTRSIDVQ